MTLANLSLSGKIPVFIDWFIIIVSTGLASYFRDFSNLVDIPSWPQLVFNLRRSIIFYNRLLIYWLKIEVI